MGEKVCIRQGNGSRLCERGLWGKGKAFELVICFKAESRLGRYSRLAGVLTSSDTAVKIAIGSKHKPSWPMLERVGVFSGSQTEL